MEFEPLKVNQYTISQLVDFIINGKVTFEEMCQAGLNYLKRKEVQDELAERQRLPNEDEQDWTNARAQDTISAYKFYLFKYDKNDGSYRGKHIDEAKYRIYEIEQAKAAMRNKLFDKMRTEPWLFTHEAMKMLLDGVQPELLPSLRSSNDIVSRFLCTGATIEYDELIDEGVISSNLSKESITSEDHFLEQTNISELGDFPADKRTDVYFFGVPRGGKSSVLAGVLSHMSKQGISVYVPHFAPDNRDRARRYYNSLIGSTSKGKFPVSTQRDSVSFMKIDLLLNKKRNLLTFVELGGEAFKQAYEDGFGGDKAWSNLGAGTCLRSNNRKLLFFIIDYSLKRGINGHSTEEEQREVLDAALDILSTDGTGKNNVVNCTFSKVDTVAVIVTKSDLMDLNDDGSHAMSREARNQEAFNYIRDQFAAFMTKLCDKCKYFGVNRPVNFRPYVYDFSIGKLNIGNTYEYDSHDSAKIVDFISKATAGTRTSLMGRIFGQ